MQLILMIVMLLNFSKIWCQNNIDSISPSTGDDNKIYIEVDYIRKANEKLIEHKYCPFIISQKDSIILLERNKYDILDSISRVAINNQLNIQKELNKDLNKKKNQVKILSGTTLGAVVAFLLTLLIK